MNRYSLYCTPEQTRKALELGAPIYVYDEINSKSIDELDVYLDDKTKLNNGLYAETPTAEQMLGWLEEQGFEFETGKCYATVNDKDKGCLGMYSGTRKDASLEAIDAALEYLATKK